MKQIESSAGSGTVLEILDSRGNGKNVDTDMDIDVDEPISEQI